MMRISFNYPQKTGQYIQTFFLMLLWQNLPSLLVQYYYCFFCFDLSFSQKRGYEKIRDTFRFANINAPMTTTSKSVWLISCCIWTKKERLDLSTLPVVVCGNATYFLTWQRIYFPFCVLKLLTIIPNEIVNGKQKWQRAFPKLPFLLTMYLLVWIESWLSLLQSPALALHTLGLVCSGPHPMIISHVLNPVFFLFLCFQLKETCIVHW